MDRCPCGSGLEYQECCEPIIKGIKVAGSPTELLRARYTAHVKCEVDYIVNTVDPEKKGDHDPKVIKKWAESALWEELKIIESSPISETSQEGTVEFIAVYREKLRKVNHHEIAKFLKKDGIWYFYDSTIPFQQVVNQSPKIGRNDPCPCGSGKKYKKCCGTSTGE